MCCQPDMNDDDDDLVNVEQAVTPSHKARLGFFQQKPVSAKLEF